MRRAKCFDFGSVILDKMELSGKRFSDGGGFNNNNNYPPPLMNPPPRLMNPPGGFRGARPRNVLNYGRTQLSAGGVHYGAQISIFLNGGNCTEMEGKSYARLVREQCLPCGLQDSTIKQHHKQVKIIDPVLDS